MSCRKFKVRSLDCDPVIVRGSGKPEITRGVLDFLKYSKYTDCDKKLFMNSVFPSFDNGAWDRFIDSSMKISYGARIPLWMDVAVTGKCHCDCWHCFRSKFSDKSDIPLRNLEKLFNSAAEMGTTIMGITGGEPMLRRDIAQVIGLVPKGVEVQLYTTGYRVDEQFLKDVEGTQFTRAVVSLDHYLSDVVNRRRNRKEAYDEVIKSLELFRNSGIYCTVTLCVTEDLCSEEEIYRYINFVTELGVDEIRVVLPVPQGKVEGVNHIKLYINARKLMRRIRDEMAEDLTAPSIFLFSDIESFSFLGCGAGSNYISVNNDGSVTPCVSVPLTFGNIYEEELRDVYSVMGDYYKVSGNTCYGKRLAKLMKDKVPEGTPYPFDKELSEQLAGNCRVEGRNGNFFQNLKNYSYAGIGNQPA